MKNGKYVVTITVDGESVVVDAEVRDGVIRFFGEFEHLAAYIDISPRPEKDRQEGG